MTVPFTVFTHPNCGNIYYRLYAVRLTSDRFRYRKAVGFLLCFNLFNALPYIISLTLLRTRLTGRTNFADTILYQRGISTLAMCANLLGR